MSTFKRKLGLLDATSVVAGSMIGSGIFLVSSAMARDLGSSGWLLLAWILTGIITMAAALSYGELAGMMPEAGGQYVYIRRAWGKLPAFLYGWSVFSVIQTGVIAAVATAFANYTSELLPNLGLGQVLLSVGAVDITAGRLVAVGSIVFLTWLNSRGVEGGSWIQKIFTSAKLLALFALIIFGLAIGIGSPTCNANFTDMWDAKRWLVDDNGVGSWNEIYGWVLVAVFGMTMINSLFSSDAWNNVTYIAGEIKDPQRNIPRSLILGTTIVTLLYCLANLAYLALLPINGDVAGATVAERGVSFAEMDRVGSAAASVMLGNTATVLMALLIMISTFGCNNGIILAGARLYYAMAKDGLFFKKAGELNDKSVPATGLWIQCIWASVLCFSGTYSDLLVYSTFASLLFYIVTIAGLFRLRKTEPGTARPYKALGYPFIPAFYILAAGAVSLILLFMDFVNTGLGLLIVLLGFPVYILINRSISKRA
jgi:APA family basic amino acid/polyamine antiporter